MNVKKRKKMINTTQKGKRQALAAVFLCVLAAMLLWPTGVMAEAAEQTAEISEPFDGTIDLSAISDYLRIFDDGYTIGTGEKQPYDGSYTLTGTTDKTGGPDSNNINAVCVDRGYKGNNSDGSVRKTITLDNVTIDVSARKWCGTFVLARGASVNLLLSGSNTLKAGLGRAGLGVPKHSKYMNRRETACVTIDSLDGGNLTAIGGKRGAGIGGDRDVDQDCGEITINGGCITAIGGTGGAAGIGGGNAAISSIADASPGKNGWGCGGKVTVNGGSVTAIGRAETGNSSFGGAGIGSAFRYHGEVTGEVTINGGSVRAVGGGTAEPIGHGEGTEVSGSLKNSAGQDVFLNTLTVGEGGQTPEISVQDQVVIDGGTGYGTKDVTTQDGGKLYFYLPNNTADPSIAVTHDGATYSAAYERNSATRDNTYTATLLPPPLPEYAITIPEAISFGSLAYRPAGDGSMIEVPIEVAVTHVKNLTAGQSLSVAVSGSGDGNAFVLTANGAELPYAVYKGPPRRGQQAAARPGAGLRLDKRRRRCPGRHSVSGPVSDTIQRPLHRHA